MAGIAWRQRVATAAAVALVGAAATVLPTTLAEGDVGTPGGFGTVGVLRLHANADGDYFRFDPSGEGASTQTTNIVPGQGCKVSLADGSLASVTVSPSNGSLGLVADGLGVRQNNEGNGQPCGQVNGTGQSITIALAGDLANRTIDRAELDIEGKFGVTVRAEMFMGATSVGTATLPTGLTSDSGPDSADGDNFRFAFGDGAIFNKVKLSVDPTTPAGAFSLEGGADGTEAGPIGATLTENQSDSIFRITNAEGVLDCGDSDTDGGEGEPAATVERLENADGSECKLVTYSLDSYVDETGQNVSFGKDLTQQPHAAFNVTIGWQSEAAQYPLPPATVDQFDGNGAQTPEWCDGTFDDPQVPDGSALSWCVRKEIAESVADGAVQRTTWFYGTGDPLINVPTIR